MRTNSRKEKKLKYRLLAGAFLFLSLHSNNKLNAQATIAGPATPCAGSAASYIVSNVAPPTHYITNYNWGFTGGFSNPAGGQLTDAYFSATWNNNATTGNHSESVGVFVNYVADPNDSYWTTPPPPSTVPTSIADQNSPLNINVAVKGVANAPAISGLAVDCVNQTQPYYIASIPGASSYLWTIPNLWSCVNCNPVSPSISVFATQANATGQICVKGKNACGYVGTTSCLSVNSLNTPVINLGPNLSVFVNTPAFPLYASLSGGTWSGTGVTKEGYFNPSVAYLGDHQVTYTYNNGGCTVTKTIVISVKPLLYYMTAITFNGANNERVTIPATLSTYPNGTGDFTMETWLKIPTTSTGVQPIFSNVDENSHGVVFYINNKNQLGLCIGGTTPILSPNTIPNLYDNVCHHLVVTRQNGVVSFYNNGVQYAGGTNAGNINSGSWYTIGWNTSIAHNGVVNALTGTMDELSFWNVSKSTANVYSDYTGGPISTSAPGLIGYWNFNEGGTVVNDISPTPLNGNLGDMAATPYGSANAPTRVQFECFPNGEVGLYFDGSTKYATIPSSAAYNFGSGAFSLETWVYIEPCGSSCVKDQVLLSSKTIPDQSHGFVFYLKNGTHLVMEFPNSGTTITSAAFPNGWNINSNDNIACNNFGVTRDISGNVTFYINGTSLSGGVCNTNVNTSQSIFVGHDDVSADGHAEFQGRINEVRIWNANRTPAQISGNQTPTVPFNTSTANLVGYWRIKELFGSQTLKDESITANNGVLGNNSTVESADPPRTFDYCFQPTDRLAHNSTQDNSAAVNQTNSFDEAAVSVFPNPFTNEFTIVLNDNFEKVYEMQISDALGRTLFSKIIDNQYVNVGSNLAAGLYVLKITDSDKKSRSYKMVKTDK